MLKRVHTHLHDDGLFAFETRNPRSTAHEASAEEYDGLFVNLETRTDESDWQTHTDASGREYALLRTRIYDHVAQILHWKYRRRWREDGEEHTRVTRIALRYTFPQELAAMLHYSGFCIVRQYGDWNLQPLTATSRSIIVVCRKSA
jgi:hypothetical protein